MRNFVCVDTYATRTLSCVSWSWWVVAFVCLNIEAVVVSITILAKVPVSHMLYDERVKESAYVFDLSLY